MKRISRLQLACTLASVFALQAPESHATILLSASKLVAAAARVCLNNACQSTGGTFRSGIDGVIDYNPMFPGISAAAQAAASPDRNGFHFAGTASVLRQANVGSASAVSQLHFYVRLTPLDRITLHLDGLTIRSPALNQYLEVTGLSSTSTFLTKAGTYQFNVLRAGDFDFTLDADVSSATFGNPSFLSRGTDFNGLVEFSNLSYAPGATQQNPVLPASSNGNAQGGTTFTFSNAATRAWFDPVVTSEYSFDALGDGAFNRILTLPTGFDDPFEIVVGDDSLGFFDGGDPVDFLALLGHGVDAFRIRNISPSTDPTDPRAFPIQLEFNKNSIDFTMTAVARDDGDGNDVPEPAVPALVALALVAALSSKRGRGPHQT